jgi:diguanylate cyclase (GGDEF)-like protein
MTERQQPEGARPFDVDHAINRIRSEAAKVRAADQEYLNRRKSVWEIFERGLEARVDSGEMTREQANEIRATDRALREINQRRDQRFGILTVTAIQERLWNDLEHADRLNEPLTLGVLDIDHFREVNNNHGHLAGDKVLEETVKHYDNLEDSTFGRWGGDEFLLYFRGQSLMQIYPKLVELNDAYPTQLEAVRTRYGITEPITMSIGITQYRYGEGVEQLMGRADTVLYRAKEQGRNRVEHG